MEQKAILLKVPRENPELSGDVIGKGRSISNLLNMRGLTFTELKIDGIPGPQLTYGNATSAGYLGIVKLIGQAYWDSEKAITSESLGIPYSGLRNQVKTLKTLGHGRQKRRDALMDSREAYLSAQARLDKILERGRDFLRNRMPRYAQNAVPTPGDGSTWPYN